MKLSLNSETIKNPKIIFGSGKLIITNKASKYFYYLAIFHIFILLVVCFQPDRVEKTPFTILVVCFLFYWLYKSLTIDTTILDTKEKSICFRTSNPIKRFFWTVLQYPTTVSYNNVSNAYVEEKAIIRNTFRKSFVILETDDSYKLAIAAFDEKLDAESFLNDLKLEILRK